MPRYLVLSSAALLVLWVVATVVAIDQGWPYEWGGTGDPGAVGEEWVGKGTLISPPLVTLLAQVLFTGALLLQRRWFLVAGGLGLAILGVLYTVASLGEPIDPTLSDPPAAVRLAFLAGALAGAALLVVLGAITAVRAVREAPSKATATTG